MNKFIVALFVAFVGVTSQASWLLWQVDSSLDLQNTGTTVDFGTDYKGGIMRATADGGKTSSAVSVVDMATGETISGATIAGYAGSNIAISLDSLQGGASQYSFFIEYVNWGSSPADPTVVAVGQTRSYEALADYVVTDTEWSPTTMATATAWHGGAHNAPEPTSAMLMLLGVAGLALRRKQRKLA